MKLEESKMKKQDVLKKMRELSCELARKSKVMDEWLNRGDVLLELFNPKSEYVSAMADDISSIRKNVEELNALGFNLMD
jgi:hypothetical protein